VVRLAVQIDRVVVSGTEVSRGALEAAIADALRDRLGVGTPPAREPGIELQVGRAVAPAVLGEAGLDRGAR
jgi:hypothetical protein